MTRVEAIYNWILPAIKNTWNEKQCEKILKALMQEPRKGYLSIDDVMSVFDDFMRGEVDEDVTNIFLEMLIDKADMREVEDGYYDKK